jgi:hypothetical protein
MNIVHKLSEVKILAKVSVSKISRNFLEKNINVSTLRNILLEEITIRDSLN